MQPHRATPRDLPIPKLHDSRDVEETSKVYAKWELTVRHWSLWFHPPISSGQAIGWGILCFRAVRRSNMSNGCGKEFVTTHNPSQCSFPPSDVQNLVVILPASFIVRGNVLLLGCQSWEVLISLSPQPCQPFPRGSFSWLASPQTSPKLPLNALYAFPSRSARKAVYPS